MAELTAAQLREEVIRLGPWHMDVEITPEVSTSAFLDAPPDAYPDSYGPISFHSPHDGFLRRLHRIFPQGLEGRSVLDCACNCGAYLFYAKEAGAGRCVGFDIREHWIKQARFLAEQRRQPTDDMRFEVCDLYDLPKLALGRFDVTFFFGIFYHLPDPVSGLKIAADMTDDLLILNGATKVGYPDGLMVAERESPTRLMSGTYGLCWFPTGPRVLEQILNWLGFPEVRCSVWRHAPRQRDDLDRIELIAARRPGFFDDWDAARPEGAGAIRETLETRTAPGTTVLALTDSGEELELSGRNFLPLRTADLAELERHRAEGAAYLVLDAAALSRLAEEPALAAHLEEHAHPVVEDAVCRVYSLDGPARR
jgi:tRNA (mo5U34)-methyltransferase